MISPEFDTFPVLSAEQNALILVFREMFVEKLRAREVAAGKTEPYWGLDRTRTWEIVYRCTYSHHWRALTDAKLVLHQVFERDAKWEEFDAFFHNPLNRLSCKAL